MGRGPSDGSISSRLLPGRRLGHHSAEGAVLAAGLPCWECSKGPLYLLAALAALGLFYDLLVLSLGTLMQSGPALCAQPHVLCCPWRADPAAVSVRFPDVCLSALGPATGNFDLIFYISMFGEVYMAMCFLLYARREATQQELSRK